MSISDAKRRANNKWTAANMTVLGCKVRKDRADAFKAACAAAGTSVNAVFAAAMDEFMKLHPVPGDPASVSGDLSGADRTQGDMPGSDSTRVGVSDNAE